MGNPEVIRSLQVGLVAEAHLNIQARQYERALKFDGIDKLVCHVDKIGDDAHYFQKKLTKRLLFLGGDTGFTMPPIKSANGMSVTDILRDLLDLETAIVGPYEEAIITAMSARDDNTRNLFEHLIKWHQNSSNIGWLQQQLSLINALGEPEYIAEKL